MPPLTLHVLPPAFYLPSISPDCIIAIAYLRYTQPYNSWIVVADAAENPLLVHPFLRCTNQEVDLGAPYVEGLDATYSYLIETGRANKQLNSSLSKSEGAQALALSSHLRTRLWPLVALSLYANSANYASATRPGFASALSLPESWVLPHQLHKSAVAACANLGIEPKDLDLLVGGSTVQQHNKVADAGPFISEDPSLQHANNKIPSVAAKIQIQRRIDNLVHAALAPFVSTLGPFEDVDASKSTTTGNALRWSFSAPNPTLADLTALALLSLAVLPYSSVSTDGTSKEPALSNPFLRSSINRQFPRLVSDYLLPGLEDAFGGRTLLEDAIWSAPTAGPLADDEEDEDDHTIEGYDNMDIGSGRTSIPWRRKQDPDGWHKVRRVGNAFGAVVTEAIGIWS